MDPLALVSDHESDVDDEEEDEEVRAESEPKKITLDFNALQQAGYEGEKKLADSDNYRRESERVREEALARERAKQETIRSTRDEAVDQALKTIQQFSEDHEAAKNVDRKALKGKMREAGDGRGMFGAADKETRNKRFKDAEGKKRGGGGGGGSHHSNKEDEKRILKQMGQGGLGFD